MYSVVKRESRVQEDYKQDILPNILSCRNSVYLGVETLCGAVVFSWPKGCEFDPDSR